MKRLNYLIAMALMAFTFTSCEDVPNPFGQILPPSSEEAGEAIEPAGSGTQADPFNIAAIQQEAAKLGTGETSTTDYYFKGTISQIIYTFSTDYGTATFFISDNGTTEGQFQCYSVLYLGNKSWKDGDTQIKEGDEVIICGKLTNYKGTLETASKQAYIYSLNGSTESGGGGDTPTPTSDLGTKDAPLTVAKAIEIINALPDNGTASPAYVKGKISKVQSYNDKYKSITYYISDDGTDNNALQVYSGKGLDGADFAAQTDLETGWTVVVTGELKKYVNANTGAVTLEINQSSQIVSLDKTSSGGSDTPTSDLGTKDNPITVAKALDVINALADGGETETEAFVKGKISKVQSFNDKYKSITYYISDDGTETKELQIYSGKNIGGAEFASKDDLTAGDEVVVKGKLKKYMKNGEAVPEMNQPNEIISITKAGGGDTPSGNTGLEASFANGEGDFTIENKEIGSLSYVWKADSKGYMKASAFVNNANNAAESWLVSPAFSLKGVTSPTMTFNNAVNYVKEGNITDHIKVMVYDGSNWTEATIANLPDGKSWTFVDSTVDLKSVAGKENVKIAFKYISTTAVAPTWEIKTVSIK